MAIKVSGTTVVDDSRNITNVIGVGDTATTLFYGDGSGLSNTGAVLSAGSGSQRLVVTSGTSGVMTTAATNANLTWDSTSGTLSATNVSIAGTLTYEDVTNVDSIGIITARSGIVLGPTANTIQLGTGTTISSPASNTFTVSTNGSERVRVSSAGSFGVGTPSPSAPAHIIATGGSTNSINIGLIVDYEATAAEQTGAGTAILFRGKSSGGDIANYDQAQISTNNAGTNNAHGLSFYYKPSAGQSLTEGLRLDTTGRLGVNNTSPTESLHVTGNILASGNVTGYSDETLKDNIQTISDALSKVTQLRGVEFDRNDIEGNPHQIGVIAQEVEKVIPEVVTTHDDGIKSVAYGNLIGVLIEAIKELKEEINELKARLEEV